MKHIAFIMDGNGRWASNRGLPRVRGHEKGAEALLLAMEAVEKSDVDIATFYAFSTENYKRDAGEVGNILGIIIYFLVEKIKPVAMQYGWNIRIIGELALMPKELRDVAVDITEATMNNKGKTFVFAICYGGAAEIAYSATRILKKRQMSNDYSPVTVDELKENLYTASLSDPDVIVRYGGYQRLSNFMPLQSIYSELMFFDKLWPDFNPSDLSIISNYFEGIKRNFGGNNA